MEQNSQNTASSQAELQAKLDASLMAGRGMLKRIKALQEAIEKSKAEEASKDNSDPEEK